MKTHHDMAGTAKVSVRTRLRAAAALALATVAVGVLVPAAHAGASSAERVGSEAYLPFVTDFPKPVGSTATAEAFTPFVTDFPSRMAPDSPSDSTLSASTSGISWEDAAIGSGVGAGLVALLAGSGLVLARRAPRGSH